MVFGLFRRKKKEPVPAPADPLVAYDALIEDLERQAAVLRKSAATLLTVRGQLQRDVERYRARSQELSDRIATAAGRGDASAERTLTRDRDEAEALLRATQENLATTAADVDTLTAAAEELNKRIRELLLERSSARARLESSTALTTALRAQVERFEQVVALEQARDDVERAHALAQIYREDRSR